MDVGFFMRVAGISLFASATQRYLNHNRSSVRRKSSCDIISFPLVLDLDLIFRAAQRLYQLTSFCEYSGPRQRRMMLWCLSHLPISPSICCDPVDPGRKLDAIDLDVRSPFGVPASIFELDFCAPALSAKSVDLLHHLRRIL